MLESWISPKTKKALPGKSGGLGFFATQDIAKGEVVFIKVGRLIDRQTLANNQEIIQGSQEQITDDLYIAPLTDEELKASMVYCNHSCDANVGINGQVVGVTMREVKAGEELCLDYAMIYDDDLVSFDCKCGSPNCRKHITGRDWTIPELQKKYKGGYFAWFLERKINST